MIFFSFFFVSVTVSSFWHTNGVIKARSLLDAGKEIEDGGSSAKIIIADAKEVQRQPQNCDEDELRQSFLLFCCPQSSPHELKNDSNRKGNKIEQRMDEGPQKGRASILIVIAGEVVCAGRRDNARATIAPNEVRVYL